MPVVAASNSKKSRPSSYFSSLPDDIVLNCLSRVPRRYYPNLSLVSKTLRSLVRSPELDRLRSQLKHVCLSYHVYHGILRRWNSYWVTFRPGDEKSKTTDYQLEQKYLSPGDVPNQPYLGSAVSVGSEIYFIGGKIFPSTELWILDTRSGHLRKGPAGMKVGRSARYKLAVGVVEGKIYVIGGSGCKNSQVEVFDLETQRWDYFEEKVEFESEFCVSMKQKVYMVGRDGRVSTYSPRGGIKNETITEVLSNVKFVCAVKNVLYACFRRSGLMWFNTNLKVWTRVVDCDGEDGKLELYSSAAQKMEEYEGKIAFFWPLPIDDTKNHLMCKLIALDRVGVNIRGRIEWSGIVATLPHNLLLKDCLVVSG